MIRTTLIDEFFTIAQAEFFPNEKWQVNSALMKGREYCVVWDTFSYPKNMMDFSHHLEKKAAMAIYSHADWDHCWGTCGYPFEHVVAHTNTLDRFENELPSTLRKMRNEHANGWKGVKLIAPDVTFDEKLTIDMGYYSLELYQFRGHTPDSIVGFIPEWGLLLGGDAFEAVPVINDPADVPIWLHHLETWMKRSDVRSVLPGHGSLTDPGIMELNYEYLQGLSEKKMMPITADSKFYQQVHMDNLKKMGVVLGKQSKS